jgi:hypothetical protein
MKKEKEKGKIGGEYSFFFLNFFKKKKKSRFQSLQIKTKSNSAQATIFLSHSVCITSHQFDLVNLLNQFPNFDQATNGIL